MAGCSKEVVQEVETEPEVEPKPEVEVGPEVDLGGGVQRERSHKMANYIVVSCRSMATSHD